MRDPKLGEVSFSWPFPCPQAFSRNGLLPDSDQAKSDLPAIKEHNPLTAHLGLP